jgi:hypothetical protein
MSRSNAGSFCYLSVQNLLASLLLPQNTKLKILRTNFACYFILVYNLVSIIKGKTEARGVSEWDAEKGIRPKRGKV